MRIRLVLLLALSAFIVGCSTRQARILSENKSVVLRSEAELWSKGNLAAADELYSPDFVCHFVVGPEWRGVQGIKDVVARHRRSFPDWNEKVEDIVAEGDRVVIRFTSTGTQEGEFEGIAPTGKKVKIVEVAIFRLVHGKIVEQWGVPGCSRSFRATEQQQHESAAASIIRSQELVTNIAVSLGCALDEQGATNDEQPGHWTVSWW